LSVNAESGLWFCHACGEGGSARSFAKRLGVEPPDQTLYTPEECYFYHNADGDVLYRIVRGQGKKFWVERPNGQGGWVNGLGDIKPVLYRLHEITNSKMPICICEGEKDVNTLWWEAEKAGIEFPVTCNPFGASKNSNKPKWRPEYTEALRGRQVFILYDNDEVGITHAKHVFKSLWGIADGVCIVDLPGVGPKEDVSDWLAQGNAFLDLITIMDNAWQDALNKGLLRPKEVHCQT
jgi:hypothetical protein